MTLIRRPLAVAAMTIALASAAFFAPSARADDQSATKSSRTALASAPKGAAPVAAPPIAPKPEDVADFEVISGSAWRVGPTIVSGQPSEATIKSLPDRGVKAVICLRSARELADRKVVPFDEAALVRSLGIEYVHVPLGTSWNYTPDALARVADAIKKHDGNVLVHCTVGFRATLAWESYQTRYAGVPLEAAMAQGRLMGMGQDQIENLLGERIEYRLTGTPKELDPGWLVNASWLTDPRNAADKSLRYLDCRPNYIQYFEGHLKNAAHFDAHALRGPAGGVPAQFRTPERMAEIFALAGVSPANRVIVYADGADILSATLAMYAMERIGHINTSLVDGGIAAVRECGLVSQDYPAPLAKPAVFEPLDNSTIAASLTDIQAALGVQSSEAGSAPAAPADRQTGAQAVLFVDARPPEQYSGAANIWRRNGHIPGAVNVFWKRLTTDDNTSKLRSRDEIRSIFQSAGVTPDRDIIVYCGTGREATLIYMYLTRELGYPRVRLFEGAWTQYAAADHLPIER